MKINITETNIWIISDTGSQKNKRATEKGALFDLLPPDLLQIIHKMHGRLVHWENSSKLWRDSIERETWSYACTFTSRGTTHISLGL